MRPPGRGACTRAIRIRIRCPRAAYAGPPSVGNVEEGDDSASVDGHRAPSAWGAQGLPQSVRSVRFLWVDHGSVIRGKAARSPGAVWISQAQMAIPLHADVVVPAAELLPVHDVRLTPDWDSLRVLPFQPGHAVVACDIYDGAQPWVHCPRGFLRRMDGDARAAGLDVRCGVELEFSLLLDQPNVGSTEQVVAVDDTAFCMDAAFDQAGEVIEEIVTALEQQGLEVAQFHPESGPGQWEVSLAPLTVVAAADAIVALRQTIRSVARLHGLKPAFLPLLTPEGAGGGMHLHLSCMGNQPGLGPHGQAFCAGILGHLHPLLAVTAGSPISLQRFRPHYWVGAFAGWGMENKEAPLRIVPTDDGSWRDVEFKAADATANPYLALGCLVAAGLDGVARTAVLPPALQGDPGLLSEEDREDIHAWPLAGDPKVTLAEFRSSNLFQQAMGRQFHSAYVAVRQADLDATSGWSFEQIRDLWLTRL